VGPLAPAEGVEDVVLLVLGDADAGVLDADLDPVVVAGGPARR